MRIAHAQTEKEQLNEPARALVAKHLKDVTCYACKKSFTRKGF
jgi:hypothetical protein